MSEPELAHAGLNLGETKELTRGQAENAIFGFWIFLMSDAVIFSLVFATYGTMIAATAGGPTGAAEFKLLPAFVETLLLLTSSAAFGRATVAMRYDEPRRVLFGWLGFTLGLGLVFLALELKDFAAMLADGAYPIRVGFAQQRAGRRRDVRRRQRCGSGLIQKGLNRWWFVRSIRTTSATPQSSCFAAANPPNPAPTITTRDLDRFRTLDGKPIPCT